MKFIRSYLALALLAGLALVVPGLSGAQDFPNRPSRLIVPTAPGGGTDAVARSLAKILQSQGVATFIENKGGAGGAIGLAAVANAAPDGYTIGVTGPDALTVMPQLMLPSELGYRADKDFLPIAQIGDTHYAFAVSSTVPVNSMAELIALAKARPGQLAYASQGRGTAGHLISKLLESRTGTQLLDVPYKGAGPAMAALMSGEAQVIATSPASLKAALPTGKLKAIASASESRSAMLPDVPTTGEAGYPGFIVSAYWGVIAPANLPEAVANNLTELVMAAARSQEMGERLSAMGGEIRPRGRAAFSEFLRADTQMWKKAVVDGKISLKD